MTRNLKELLVLETLRAGVTKPDAPPKREYKDETEKAFFEGDGDKPLKHKDSGFHPKRFIPEHHNILDQHRYEYKGKEQVGNNTFYHYKKESSGPGYPKYKVSVRQDGAWLGGGPGVPSRIGLSSDDLAQYLGSRQKAAMNPNAPQPNLMNPGKGGQPQRPGMPGGAGGGGRGQAPGMQNQAFIKRSY